MFTEWESYIIEMCDRTDDSYLKGKMSSVNVVARCVMFTEFLSCISCLRTIDFLTARGKKGSGRCERFVCAGKTGNRDENPKNPSR